MIRTILLHNLSSRLLRNSRFCFYGKTLLREKVTVLNSIRQGGLLNIEAIKPAIAKITISSAWQDHCELEFPDDAEGYINIAEDSQEGSALIELSEAFKDFELKIKVPEYIDIALNSSALDLIMKNKVHKLLLSTMLLLLKFIVFADSRRLRHRL